MIKEPHDDVVGRERIESLKFSPPPEAIVCLVLKMGPFGQLRLAKCPTSLAYGFKGDPSGYNSLPCYPVKFLPRGAFARATMLFATRTRLEWHASPVEENGSAEAPQVGLSFPWRSYDAFQLCLIHVGEFASMPPDQLMSQFFSRRLSVSRAPNTSSHVACRGCDFVAKLDNTGSIQLGDTWANR